MTSDNLKDLRADLGLTQTEMARAMGLTLSPYQTIEAQSGDISQRHRMLAERVALARVASTGETEFLPKQIRDDFFTLAKEYLTFGTLPA